MKDLKKQAQIAKKMINSLIEYLDAQGVDSKSLKQTYLLIDMIEDEETLKKVLTEVSKTLESSMESMEQTAMQLSKVKMQAKEEIESYEDTKETESLINNL